MTSLSQWNVNMQTMKFDSGMLTNTTTVKALMVLLTMNDIVLGSAGTGF